VTDNTEPDWRTDPLTGEPVVLVRARQDRPNRPSRGCPFCPGGLEAPEPYQVRWFVNRWPSLPQGRCEVVLFSPDHDASLGQLEEAQLDRVITIWTERTAALGARPDVAYVLLFENRGAEVGATIPHPHGQIYAFGEIPPAPHRELAGDRCAICEELAGAGRGGPSHQSRLIAEEGGWQAFTTWAPAWPFELLIAPADHLPDLPAAARSQAGLGRALKAGLSSLDLLFDAPTPYMLWCHQRPADNRTWATAHLHFHVAPAWRERGVLRYVAAGELGSGVFFNPVDPEEAAQRLREALARPRFLGREIE